MKNRFVYYFIIAKAQRAQRVFAASRINEISKNISLR
jgi:hypothetical protein